MTVELVQIEKNELAAMVRGIVAEELKEIRAKILYVPDVTLLSDEEAARRRGVSISTLRRMKADGRINSILTPKGRMCRVCDVQSVEESGEGLP